MIPTSFDESNDVLSKPEEMDDEECGCLAILRTKNEESGTPVIVSCWKMSKEELAEITRTGRVWLTVAATTMPPACIDGLKPF